MENTLNRRRSLLTAQLMTVRLIPFVIFVPALLGGTCTSLPDFPPRFLVGQSYHEAAYVSQERSLHYELGSRDSGLKVSPLLFFSAVPGARKIGALLSTKGKLKWFVSPLLFGGLGEIDRYGRKWKAGTETVRDGPLNLLAGNNRLKVARDEVLILHRVRMQARTAPFWEYYNGFFGVILIRIEDHWVEGELAKIKTGRLMEYLSRKKAPRPASDSEAPDAKAPNTGNPEKTVPTKPISSPES